ncbi:MAG TPA: dihydroorotate dehydrogenase-like protein, partial [Acidobacteriota bacterium]|nr:dihydroorotate dehydrogenase-like protein [Acidobacteriota bacterium]
MNLETKYLGLDIKNPVIAGASILTEDLANLKAMEKAGAGAVVLGSLFEEQVIEEENMLDHFFSGSSESFAEAVTYFPRLGEYRSGPEQYLDFIRKAKGALSIPVIASLNGVSTGGWVKIAGEIEKAGADA